MHVLLSSLDLSEDDFSGSLDYHLTKVTFQRSQMSDYERQTREKSYWLN